MERRERSHLISAGCSINNERLEGGILLKKEYTQSEMEQILRNDAEIPESVDRRMKETYAKLGLTAFAAARALNVTVKEENGKAVQQVSVEPTKK